MTHDWTTRCNLFDDDDDNDNDDDNINNDGNDEDNCLEDHDFSIFLL